MLAGANEQAQSVANRESRHEGARDKAAGAGYEAKGLHAFTIGKRGYRFMTRSRRSRIANE